MSNSAPTEPQSTAAATITKFSLSRPVTISMMFISFLLLGAIASRLLPLEKFPGIDIPAITISVPYANSTPAEVERLLSRPIEEAVSTISGIQRVRSYSNPNGSDVVIEFKWDEDIQTKSLEIREKIDAIRHELPTDVERVFIFQFNTGDLPIFQLRISSERDLSLAYDMLERHLQRPLERISGVSKVELYGVAKSDIIIQVDANKLLSHNISLVQLQKVLNNNNFSMNAGVLHGKHQNLLIKPVGEYKSLDDVKNVLITPNVRLQDVASVTLQLPELEEGRHLNQTYAIGMSVFKESNANLVDVANAAIQVIEKAGENPQFNSINLFIMDNMANDVTTSLSDLLNAGLIGSMLSIFVLYLFIRNLRTTLLVTASVPFAICMTLGVMYLLGYTLNILSMMGLMLAIGMLVDNAVVVTESIIQEKQHYKSAKQATIVGVNKVSLAVLAGTLTTVIVFLPNIVGEKVQLTIFLEHVAIAICIALCSSLLIAQTLIPSLATRIDLKISKAKKESKISLWYRKTLTWSLNHQIASGFAALLLIGSVAIPMASVGNSDDDDANNGRLYIEYELNDQYPLATTEKMVTRVEEYLFANKDAFYIDSVYSFYTPSTATTTLLLKEDLPISLSKIKELVREDWPELARGSIQFSQSGGEDSGISLYLYGNSTEVLMQISEDVYPFLNAVPELTDVNTGIQSNQKELQIHIDRKKAHLLGLNPQQVTAQISAAIRGQNLRTFRNKQVGELRVQLKFEDDYRSSIDGLKTLPILKTDNKVITLAQVADITQVPRFNRIYRTNRQTSLLLTANLKEGVTLETAEAAINKAMENVNLPHGYQWSLDGSFSRIKQNGSIMLRNTLLAVALIYIVMAAMFESLLLPTAVLMSLLLSIVGVFWTLFILGIPMSVMSMIGILILIGIVVNNGIVLVDQFNQRKHDKLSLHGMVVDASATRTKPILMTAATTILGLVPLAIGSTSIGGDGPSYSPMAITIIGGLSFSTIASLYLVPLGYVWLLNLRNYFWRLFRAATVAPRLSR